jgi:hypothetical protein
MADILRYDYDTVSADGSDNLTQTILDLLNQYPALEQTGLDIEFQVLDTVKGIAMFPNPSIAIISEKESVTGHVKQKCAYAFTVVYRTRANAGNKIKVKEWLDNLGRWVEKQKVRIADEEYQLHNYPVLSEGKAFDKIERTSQGYLYGNTEDKAEDWAISIQATYFNEYDK